MNAHIFYPILSYLTSPFFTFSWKCAEFVGNSMHFLRAGKKRGESSPRFFVGQDRLTAAVAAAVESGRVAAAGILRVASAADPEQNDCKQDDDPPRIVAPARRIEIHNVFLLLWITSYPMISGGNWFLIYKPFFWTVSSWL